MRIVQTLLLLATLIAVFVPPVARAVGPAVVSYEVMTQDGDIEVRRYPSAYVIATDTTGEGEAPVKQGFDRLLAYLDGGNETAQKIPLMLPLMQTRQQANVQTIWTASSVLSPRKAYPGAADPRVRFERETASRWAVIRFAGQAGERNVGRHEKTLRDWLAANDIRFADPPRYAFYDPPWMPAFMRRNEVMLKLID